MSVITYNVTDWEQGTFSQGNPTESSSRVRTTDFMAVTPNDTAEFTVYAVDKNGVQLQCNIRGYDADKQWISGSSFVPYGVTFTSNLPTSYVKLVLKYSSDVDISPSDIGSCVFVYDDLISWYIINGELTNTNFIDGIQYAVTQPYPQELWRIGTGGILTHELLSDKVDLGAFANATNLRQISIPKSCKKIGREAFRNTQLTSVTIASDCVYYPTSFPDGCVVLYYNN